MHTEKDGYEGREKTVVKRQFLLFTHFTRLLDSRAKKKQRASEKTAYNPDGAWYPWQTEPSEGWV